MARLNEQIETLIEQSENAFRHGMFDEKHFRALVDVCQAAARVPALERQLLDANHELTAAECELSEMHCSGEIVDDGRPEDL